MKNTSLKDVQKECQFISMAFNFEYDCDEVLYLIKRASWFPYKSGNLKFHATQGVMLTSDTYMIHFDSTIAPYVEYLEEGTGPHNIPRAFGRPLPFGTKGKFNGKFHPGSTKHQNFIKEKCVNEIINFFSSKYNAEVTVE